MTWKAFSSASYDRFVPWRVREESRMRFDSLRDDTMMGSEYEIHFFQLACHATTIIPTEAERVFADLLEG